MLNKDRSPNSQKVRDVLDFLHRTVVHHTLWFSEVQHRYGREKALALMAQVSAKTYNIHINRIAKILDFELTDGLPQPLLSLSEAKLDKLKKGIAVNWLACDGVWFQAVESAYGIDDAKGCNDACWAQFSPFEAWAVKSRLQLPDNAGLSGLKKALNYRIYADINQHQIIDETSDSFVFKILDCRVQQARERKDLPAYPCKSAGIIEYRSFAQTIDNRIKTRCLHCPPDTIKDSAYCSWLFSF